MKKQKIKRIFDNNIYMLGFVAKHTPDFLFWMAAEGIIWGMIHSFGSVIFVKLLFDSLGEGSFEKSAWVIAAMAMFSLATYFFHVWYWNIYNPKAHQRLHLKMQKSLFEKARSLDLSCYDDPKFYNDFVWAVNESDRRVGAIMEDTGKLINRVVATATIIGVLLSVDAASIILIISVVGISAVFNRIRQRLRISQREEAVPVERKSGYIARVYRLPEYAKEVRMGDIPSLLNEKYNDSINERIRITKKYNKKVFAVNSGLSIVQQLLLNVGITLILLYKLMVSKSILLGDFAAANNAVWKLYWQINSLVDFLMKFPEHSLYTEKFRAFMEYTPKVCSKEAVLDKIETIEFKNVDFAYQQEKVLDNVSFTIRQGEKIAVVGYNGAGKSTLIKLLMHFYDVSGGQILINGRDICEYSTNDYREKIGAVFQDYRIFSATIAENVISDNVTEKDRDNVLAALKKSGFHEKLSSLEKGIDSVLTREFNSDGVELSGGERQKIAIARAFAHDYQLIVMDEPSSALDPMAEYELNRNVKNNLSDKTVIFISHRLSTTRMADRIIMFDKGRIIEEGSHDELMHLGGKYAEMFNLQAEKYRKKEEVQ